MSDRFRFRAWNKKTKEMFYNAEETYDNSWGVLDRCSFDEVLTDKDYIVEQCTGLQDKNSELIYEGDLLKIAIKSNNYSPLIFDNLPVIYKDGSFGVMQERIFHCLGSYAPNVCFEVIGNIHENPELLEDKK